MIIILRPTKDLLTRKLNGGNVWLFLAHGVDWVCFFFNFCYFDRDRNNFYTIHKCLNACTST